MTTTEPPDDSYPSNWRPREAVERDRALDPTEAELWLGSLSPAELQATLKRARGPELTMRINTTLVSLADAQRLCAAVEGCGVTVPKTLSDVLQAHERLTAATSVANPTKKLVAAALDDRATADKVDQALERHALARLVAEERRGLDQHIQPELLNEFGRRLESGGGEVLTLLRGAFEDASCTLREALTIVDLSADPATFLQTASPEQVAAYQRVAPAVAVLDRLSEIAAMLGPLASFPCVEDPRNVYPTVAAGWLLDVPVMCTSGNLLQACAQFHKPRPVGDVRHSPWVDGRAVLAQRRLCPRTTPRLG
jgi:hypothetical protein